MVYITKVTHLVINVRLYQLYKDNDCLLDQIKNKKSFTGNSKQVVAIYALLFHNYSINAAYFSDQQQT